RKSDDGVFRHNNTPSAIDNFHDLAKYSNRESTSHLHLNNDRWSLTIYYQLELWRWCDGNRGLHDTYVHRPPVIHHHRDGHGFLNTDTDLHQRPNNPGCRFATPFDKLHIPPHKPDSQFSNILHGGNSRRNATLRDYLELWGQCYRYRRNSNSYIRNSSIVYSDRNGDGRIFPQADSDSHSYSSRILIPHRQFR